VEVCTKPTISNIHCNQEILKSAVPGMDSHSVLITKYCQKWIYAPIVMENLWNGFPDIGCVRKIPAMSVRKCKICKAIFKEDLK
jgi:hypothetical protein